MDIGINPLKNLTLLARFSDLFLSDLSDNLQNQLQFSSSTVYSFTPDFLASAGFYYTYKKSVSDYYYTNGEMYAFYLTAGLSFNYNIFNFDLALADSHLMSGEYWKQTIGKITVGFQL